MTIRDKKMGRKIKKHDEGYAIHEDSSEKEERVSRFFKSKEEIKEKFLEVGFPKESLKIFLESEWVPTMSPFGGSREIDMALKVSGMYL